MKNQCASIKMLGLYVHVPFCKKKCNYCNFISFTYDKDLVHKYLTTLNKEISLRLPSPATYHLHTIYIGGGTPSVLSKEQIEFLFSAIYRNFDSNKVREITFECNPESLDKTKLETLRKLNVNRLSIGLQSFNNQFLKTLGRLHNVDNFLKIFYLARNIGFNNISIDLIYGIPAQSFKDWQNELKNVVNLSPEHISIYSLTIEHGTLFSSQGICVDEDLQADMYEYAVEFLTKKGYEHYEISNFGKIKCEHNQIYWRNEPYVGLGVSAASYLDGTRSKNTEDIGQYISFLESNKLPVIMSEKLNGARKSSERLILRLRLMEGTELLPGEEEFAEKLKNLKQIGLIDYIDKGRWQLTRRGILLSNHVFRELL